MKNCTMYCLSVNKNDLDIMKKLIGLLNIPVHYYGL